MSTTREDSKLKVNYRERALKNLSSLLKVGPLKGKSSGKLNSDKRAAGKSADLDEKVLASEELAEKFLAALMESQGLIAGGFALSLLLNKTFSTDVDVYVTSQTFQPILQFLENNGFYQSSHEVSPYCTSFMRRNHIICRLTYFLKGIFVDLMILHERSPVECASNFDLTCCQVWFDGENLDGTHLKQTLKYKAWIRDDYVPCFISGNDFTHKRVKKYTKRGFDITLPSVCDVGNMMINRPKKRLDVYALMCSNVLQMFILDLSCVFPLFALKYPEVFSQDFTKMVNVAVQLERRLNTQILAQNIAFSIVYKALKFTNYLLTKMEDGGKKANTLGPDKVEPVIKFKNVFKTRQKLSGYIFKIYTDARIFDLYHATTNRHQPVKQHEFDTTTPFLDPYQLQFLDCVTPWIDKRDDPLLVEIAITNFCENYKMPDDLCVVQRKFNIEHSIACFIDYNRSLVERILN